MTGSGGVPPWRSGLALGLAWAAFVGGALCRAAEGAPAAGGTSASSVEPPAAAPVVLDPGDLEKTRALFGRLREAFLSGDYKAAREVFVARTAAEETRLAQLAQTLRREFRAEKYSAFEVLELAPDDRIGDARFAVWARLRSVYNDRRDGRERENRHNDVFLIERLADGTAALVDSAYFDTLGCRQGVNLVADAILAGIVVLAALIFWVWMGYEAFSLRPRSLAWRLVVVLLPALGALVFFFTGYLRARQKQKALLAAAATPP